MGGAWSGRGALRRTGTVCGRTVASCVQCSERKVVRRGGGACVGNAAARGGAVARRRAWGTPRGTPRCTSWKKSVLSDEHPASSAGSSVSKLPPAFKIWARPIAMLDRAMKSSRVAERATVGGRTITRRVKHTLQGTREQVREHRMSRSHNAVRACARSRVRKPTTNAPLLSPAPPPPPPPHATRPRLARHLERGEGQRRQRSDLVGAAVEQLERCPLTAPTAASISRIATRRCDGARITTDGDEGGTTMSGWGETIDAPEPHRNRHAHA